MSNTGGFSTIKISSIGGDSRENSYVWTSEKIDQLISDINNGIKDIKKLGNSPFKDNDINLKRENLHFEYTPEELEELAKCKSSLLYFTYNYCVIQTDSGRKVIKDTPGLRDFQEEILKSFKENNLNILMASRQTGKTVTSAIFMLWFLLFHPEKTALAVADNFTTTKELIEKFKISLEGLPFFMKPGIETINASNIKFDSNSRLVGRTTTKKSGIGLTVNLLYIDEFAHINEANLDEFYRAIFPTVTADPNGKIIITSTPNGKNKFWEIWKDAVDRKSSYVPLRVDWWQVPGRGEEWKKKTIADIGSIESFNQEYGLQFFSSDKLLLNSKDLKKLDNIKSEYVRADGLFLNEDLQYVNESLYLHKKYSDHKISDFKSDGSKYLVSIDTADGIGGDYSVLNIYKMVTLPVRELLKKKEIVKNELDTVSLVQVGYLRSNQIDINQFSTACEAVIYKMLNPDSVRIVLEMNHKGDIIYNRIKDNDSFWPSQMIHTKHTQAAVNFKPGLRLGPVNKIKYCEKFRYYVTINRIIPNDYLTIMELMSFGKSKGGIYRGQNGNDDLAMTSVNMASLFESNQFWDIAVDTFESAGDEYRKEVEEKIFSIHRGESRSSMYDFNSLKEMNASPKNKVPNSISGSDHVFNVESAEKMIKLSQRFFKS